MGITLDELRKKAQKQIKKKNYLGYFQKFNAGNVPLNNAIFNSIMDTSDSDAVGDISGVGEADGGIGMVGGAMGEDLEVKKVDTQEMPEEETVTFHYTSKDENPNDKWYEVKTSTVTVPKEDVIQALLNLLRYTEEFAYMDDSDFESTVRKYWRELKDEYYEELFNLFNQNMEDVAPENFTDEFYDDDVISFNYEDEEEPDAEFTSTEFEDIDSDDPTFESKYDPISKYDLEEDYYDVDFDALLDQAFNYGYNYGFEGEAAFQKFLNKLYEKYSLEDYEEKDLRDAFYNGNHQAEMDEEEKYYNEEFNKTPYIPEYSEQNPEDDFNSDDEYTGHDEFDDDWRIGLELFDGGKSYKVISVIDEREVDGYELSIVGAIGNGLSNADEEVYFVLLDSDIEWGPVDTAEEAIEWASDVRDGYYSDDEDDFDSDDEYTGYDESLITESPDMFGFPTDDELEVEYQKRKDRVAKQREKAQAKYDSAKSLPVSKIIDKSSKSFSKDKVIKTALLDIAASYGLSIKQTSDNYYITYNNIFTLMSMENDNIPIYTVRAEVGFGVSNLNGRPYIKAHIRVGNYASHSNIVDLSVDPLDESITIGDLFELVADKSKDIANKFNKIMKHAWSLSSKDSDINKHYYRYEHGQDLNDFLSTLYKEYKLEERLTPSGREKMVSDKTMYRAVEAAKTVDPNAKGDYDDDVIYGDDGHGGSTWVILLDGDGKAYNTWGQNATLTNKVEKAVNDAADAYWAELDRKWEKTNKRLSAKGTKESEEDEFSYDDEPLQESFMSNLDLELQDPEYIKKLEKNIKALEDELDFLRNQAPKEIRKGGNFDSQEEIDDAIEQTERELAREQAKYKIIERAGLI